MPCDVWGFREYMYEPVSKKKYGMSTSSDSRAMVVPRGLDTNREIDFLYLSLWGSTETK